MRIRRLTALLMLLLLALTLTVKQPVYAANTTVTGTVNKQTNTSILFLDTSGGTMQIKIDSNTDLNDTKVILPGSALTVEVYYGSDAYMHAASIKGGTVGPIASIDTSNASTVTGTIAEGTTSDLIYLSTSGGMMQIKLDTTTDMEGCRFIMLGLKVQIRVARGSDAYMHALSVTDVSSSSGSTTIIYSGSSAAKYSNLPAASGTIGEDSSGSKIYLGSTKYYIDMDTDFSGCKAYFEGRAVTVNYYKDLNGNLHAARVSDSTATSSTASLDSSTATVTGIVSDDSKNNVLYLKTDGGTMQIKIDASTNMDNCPMLEEDMKIKVTVARGSDEYMHAVSITNRQ